MANLFTAQVLRVLLLWVYLHTMQVDKDFNWLHKKKTKCDLLRNGNRYGFILKGYYAILKNNANIKVVLEGLKYCEHQWLICMDLKMTNFLLSWDNTGCNKHLCCLCYWDSRANNEHWGRKEWSPTNIMKPGEKISWTSPGLLQKHRSTTITYQTRTNEAICESTLSFWELFWIHMLNLSWPYLWEEKSRDIWCASNQNSWRTTNSWLQWLPWGLS